MSISLNAGRSGPWFWSWPLTVLLLLNIVSLQPLQGESVCSAYGSGVELVENALFSFFLLWCPDKVLGA